MFISITYLDIQLVELLTTNLTPAGPWLDPNPSHWIFFGPSIHPAVMVSLD